MSARNELPGDVVAALMRGDRIQAVKLLRDASGQGLKEAMAAVEAYAARGQGAAQQKRTVTDAIRHMREANPGMDQKSARLAQESIQRTASVQIAADETQARTLRARDERTPTVVEGDRGGYAVVLLAIAAALAALMWWFFTG